jgi:hypothetical protein
VSRNLLTLISLLLFATGFSFAQSEIIVFEEKVQRFGKVEEGETVLLQYSFLNIGNVPLFFNSYHVNCICTTVALPETPIHPDSSGIIYLTFDTNGKFGYQERNVTLQSNVGKSTLVFKGVVKGSKSTKASYRETH